MLRCFALFFSVFWACQTQAVILEVRRNANIIVQPVSGSSQIGRIEATSANPVNVQLVGLERQNGYYRIFVPNANQTGWIHKSRGRLRTQEVRDTVSEFDRDTYEHWIDEDEDCQDTRQEVLISSSNPPAVLTASGCTVVSGTWLDPYTGNTFTSPSDIDIDHLVPLENAHLSGGWNWTEDRRREYANFLVDEGHLLAVDDSENQSKGGKGPDEYMPPNSEFHCSYVDNWIRIKREWGLTMTVNEAESTFRVHIGCGN